MLILSKDILLCIFDYLLEYPYKFLDWVIPYKNKLNTTILCSNTSPYIIRIIKYLIETNNNDICWWRLSLNQSVDIINILDKLLTESFDKYSKLLDWELLSENKSSIKILEKYPEYIDWYFISSNSNAMHLIKENLDKISWDKLCQNVSDDAILLLRENPNKINYETLAENINPNAIKLFEENINNIINLEDTDDIWSVLSCNNNAYYILQQYPNKIDYNNLSGNENNEAIKLLEQNFDKINWQIISSNKSDSAIELLIKHIDKVYWPTFSTNPKAIHLLEQNIDNIDFRGLSKNPAIFELNHDELLFMKNKLLNVLDQPKQNENNENNGNMKCRIC
jgi:hypothetical protein